MLNEMAWCTLFVSANKRGERSIEREETFMNQQQREWKIFGLGAQLLYFALGLMVFGLAGSLWMKEYRSRHFHLTHASHA
jgi:hypothetical protein